MDLNERIAKYLSCIPPAVSGQGGHNQTFACACALYNGFALSEAEVFDWLTMYNERCAPKWTESDLRHKAKSAAAAQHSKPRGHLINGNGTFQKEDFKYTSFPAKEPPKPVTLDPATEIEKFLKGFRCAEGDLSEASPIHLNEDWAADGPLLVRNLYQSGELINFVTDFKKAEANGQTKAVPSGYGRTMERDDLEMEFLMSGVPQSDAGGWMRMNPLDGQGIADKNVVAFRFILLEFDSIPLDLQMSLLARVPLPIAAILTSGGKSVHAWVKADCKDHTDYKDTATMLLKMLTKFGLDAKNKNPARLSRLVGATRKIGASEDGRQRLIYLNPKPEQKAILCP